MIIYHFKNNNNNSIYRNIDEQKEQSKEMHKFCKIDPSKLPNRWE